MTSGTLTHPVGTRLTSVSWRRVFGLLGVSLAYYVAAEAAFLIGTLSDRIFAPFWPPNMVLFGALLFTPRKRWWQIVAAVFPAHVVAELGVGMTTEPLLIAFATNCLVAVLNAVSVRWLLGDRPWLGTVRNAVVYIVATAAINPAVAAFGGALTGIPRDGEWGDYWLVWSAWFLGNALNALTLGPIVLSWGQRGGSAWWPQSLRRGLESGLFAIAFAVAVFASFDLSVRVSGSPFVGASLCLPLPILIWGSLRFGGQVGSGGILALTVLSIWNALNRPSPFALESAEVSVLSLQLFLIGMAIPILLLSAAADQLRSAERIARTLVGSLLKAQDEERRRIARDLHDTTAQNLIAAGLLAETVPDLGEAAGANGRTVKELIRQSVTELQTVAYLLHPPLLDQGGLGLALPAYAKGFSERSDVKITLVMAPDFPRLSVDAELVLYRVVQEALTNIARHSGSETAEIRLQHRPRSMVELSVSDFGTGILPSAAASRRSSPRNGAGIGLDSMRERLEQVGGHLRVKSSPGKTTVLAVIPLDP